MLYTESTKVFFHNDTDCHSNYSFLQKKMVTFLPQFLWSLQIFNNIMCIYIYRIKPKSEDKCDIYM